MKKRHFLTLCLAALMTACGQKQSVVTVPASQIDVEKLRDSIDYAMDISALSLADIRTLRCAPAAQRGFPFKDSYIRGLYLNTTWYDSLMYAFDENMPWNDYPPQDDETIYERYQRMVDGAGLLTFTEQEQQFISRLDEREQQLRKQNFTAGKGLRVNMANLTNPAQLKEFDPRLCQQLARDGFAVVPARNAQLFQLYEQNDYQDFPNFVTTDLFLQLYHLYIDCMLREVEEQKLLPLITDFASRMYHASADILRQAGDDEMLRQTAERNTAYYAVACRLLSGQYPQGTEPDELMAGEVDKALRATDDFSRLMLDYTHVKFPYSLFRPRGHYTRSESLQRYFRGMMWLQSVPLGMDHQQEVRQAVMMACTLSSTPQALAAYKRLDRIITYLMGTPDNLSLTQVLAQVERTAKPMTTLLRDDAAMSRLTAALTAIGNTQTRIRPHYERTSHNKICVMPQRYQPDAEVLLKMVDYTGNPTRRATPRGTDFFAAMGVTSAAQILAEESSPWEALADSLASMRKRMAAVNWQQSIATQWMHTLTLLTAHPDSTTLPYFMQAPLWARKDLNAALASWAELKHDAILYAKQPIGAECGGGGPPEPIIKGYVEPNLPFWRQAAALLDSTARVLTSEQLMTERIEGATTRIRDEAEFLLRCSEKELAGHELTDEEYDQIEYIGATFENISLDLLREPDQYLNGWDNVQGADKRVAVVADVYTANADNNPQKSILYEAVGDADQLYVVVEVGGYLYLTRGAVLSYREFTQPLGQPRLTDEEWQRQLLNSPRQGVPQWMLPIIVPLNKEPEPNDEIFYSSGC